LLYVVVVVAVVVVVVVGAVAPTGTSVARISWAQNADSKK